MTADDSCIVSQVFNACPTHRALPCSRNGAEQHCGDFVCQVCDRVIAGCPCKVNLSNSNWADKDLQSRQLTYPATFSQFSRRSSDGQSKVAVGWLDWATSLQPHPMALQLGPAMTLPLSSTSTACISSKVTGYDWIHSNFFSIIQWRNHSTVLERLSLDLLAQVSSCSHPTPRQITLVCPLCSKKQSLRMFPPLLQESVCWFSMLFSATKLLVFDGFSANLQEFEKKNIHTFKNGQKTKDDRHFTINSWNELLRCISAQTLQCTCQSCHHLCRTGLWQLLDEWLTNKSKRISEVYQHIIQFFLVTICYNWFSFQLHCNLDCSASLDPNPQSRKFVVSSFAVAASAISFLGHRMLLLGIGQKCLVFHSTICLSANFPHKPKNRKNCHKRDVKKKMNNQESQMDPCQSEVSKDTKLSLPVLGKACRSQAQKMQPSRTTSPGAIGLGKLEWKSGPEMLENWLVLAASKTMFN